MRKNIEGRIRELEEKLPRGYRTFDANGKPAVESDLPAFEWMQQAENLLNGRGRAAEKKRFQEQLDRSVGPDEGGGLLYQLVAAMYHGPIEQPPVSAPARRKRR